VAAAFRIIDCQSAAEGDAALVLCFFGALRLSRQLQNRRLLVFPKHRQQHDPAIRKFQRIMVRGYFLLINLPEDGSPLIDCAASPDDIHARRRQPAGEPRSADAAQLRRVGAAA
jgi:hypothetical protein